MFPKAFQADGTTPVTLTLMSERNWLSVSQNLTVGQLIFDNVKLVPAADVMSENLVSGGDFSEGGSTSRDWTSTSWESAASTNGYSANLVLCSSGSIQAYGANWHDGNKTAVIVDNSRIWQNVTFPETGCHRLSLAARQRVSWDSPTAKKPCPVRFWIARDGVTNEIARFAPCVTNFMMYSWSFDVPESGEWMFCVEGLGATEEYPGKDMNTLIDDISLVRTPLRSQTPDIPEDIEINVAEGAKLRLDYQGVCTAGRVRINGFSRSGIISAAEYPQSISGDGALYVQPRGTVLTVR